MMDPASYNSLSIRICSYNCRGYNDSKEVYVCGLLDKCDFLFLQEHWLTESQLSCLSSVSNDHLAIGVCGFDNRQAIWWLCYIVAEKY